MADRIIRWARTADSPVPVAVRRVRRLVARAQAIRRSGSIVAFMKDVVDEAPAHQRHPAAEPGPLRATTVRANPRRAQFVAVSTYPLHPRHSGGQLRGWYLSGALTADGSTDVTIVSLTTRPERAGDHELAPGLRERCIAIPAAQTDREARLRLVVGPTSITDIAAALMWTGLAEFRNALEEELAGARAAILVQPYLAEAVRTLAPDLPTVCDEHNDELMLKRSMISPNPGGSWLLERIDAIERVAIETSRLTTATTEADLLTLGRRYRLPTATAVIPNGVDTRDIEFVVGGERHRRRLALSQETGIARNRPTALFVGSGHRPNIDAGRRIIDAARRIPEVDFLLAGRHSSALGRSRLPRNVHLLGPVSDHLLDLLLSGADVALNPMSAGSGSNLKLLSYLAAGLPVVSTGVGARGIDAEAAGVLTADSDDLAAGIRALIGHNNSERSIAGRHYVEEHCDWRAIGRRFAALVAEHAG